ncbi:RNA polymerase sigma factor [compost metagenome]
MKAFLYISAKNACLDGIEQEQRKSKRDNNWYLQRSDFEPDVEERIIHAEVLMEISQAIDLLPEQCRKIMKMSYEQGMSGKQIAEEMRLTVSTVNNQKARGISLLRKTLSVKGFSLLLVLLNHDLFS